MPTKKLGSSSEDILRKLLVQSKAKWGADRTQEIYATLENTSRHLSEVCNNLPDKETEPGFYQ